MTIRTYLENMRDNLKMKTKTANDDGSVDTNGLASIALTLVIVILGAYIGITVLASLLPTFASAVKNISANFTTADWGNATANGLGPIFGLVISLLGMFAIVGLVFYAMKVRTGKGGV